MSWGGASMMEECRTKNRQMRRFPERAREGRRMRERETIGDRSTINGKQGVIGDEIGKKH